MAVREQAATPAAAKRNRRACAKWRIEWNPKLAAIGWYRKLSKAIIVAAQGQAIGCFSVL
jgi:hypothetical protein